jgi:hypothetical protein
MCQVSKEANAALLNLQPYAEQPVKVEVGPVLAIISRELRSEQELTRLEALRWCVEGVVAVVYRKVSLSSAPVGRGADGVNAMA